MKILKKMYGVGLVSILGLIALPSAAQKGLTDGLVKGMSTTALNTSVRAGAEAALRQASADRLLQSAFYATNDIGLDMGFSGTIFKTVYQGKEELYGVIAAHTVTEKFAELKLGKGFTAHIFADGQFVSIPAQIVQHSAPGMLDLALVKFRPEDESLLVPLTISRDELKPREELQTGGFTLGRSVFYRDRRVLSMSPFLFRSPIGGDKQARVGLCGAFVTNSNKELVGVHTGSLSLDDNFDMGYATHAKYLDNLVYAYHHNGEGTFPFVIDGDHIMDLRVDEYVSEVEIYDASEEKMYHLRFKSRFSYNDVVSLLHDYNPRYMDVTVRRASWGKYHRTPVITENPTATLDRNCVTYRYDLKEKKIVLTYKRATLGNAIFKFFGI